MIEDNLSDRGLFELELSENILSENEFSEKGLSEKDRLISVLKGKSVDRPPVICPGGMMNAAVTEVVSSIEGNHNTEFEAMVKTAKRVREMTGFENYGVPFCMTAEVEPFGATVDYGDKCIEPRVTKYSDLDMELLSEIKLDVRNESRAGIVIDAIKALSNKDIPVIGNITGHISTASSVVDPNVFFQSIN